MKIFTKNGIIFFNAIINKIIILLCFFYVSVLSNSFVASGINLPSSEYDAQIQLSEGLLDSSVWDVVHEYYTEPLNVPLGELKFLRNLFPDLPKTIPTTAKQLSKYEPWTLANQNKFIDDYPYLIPFLPLLSFDSYKINSIGSVSFSYRKTINNLYTIQRGVFNLFPTNNFKIKSSIYFGNGYVRWARRNVKIIVPDIASVTLGNFVTVMNNGLFYGHFLSDNKSADNIAYNWIYGNSRSWNGILVKSLVKDIFGINGFIHYGQFENVVGLRINKDILNNLSFYLGTSVLDDFAQNDTSSFIHCGFDVRYNEWTLDFNTGLQIKQYDKIPINIVLSKKNYKRFIQLNINNLPKNYSNKHSRVLWQIFRNIEHDNDTLCENIVSVDFELSDKMFDILNRTLFLGYVTGKNTAVLSSRVRLSIEHPLIVTFNYFMKYDAYLRLKSNHKINISVSKKISDNFRINSEITEIIKDYEFYLFKYFASVELFSQKVISITPSVESLIKKRRNNEVLIGLDQRIKIFDKTFGHISLKLPISDFDEKGLGIYAEIHFAF